MMVRTNWIEPLVLFALASAGIADGFRIIVAQEQVTGAGAAGGWIAIIGMLLLIATGVDLFKQARRGPVDELARVEKLNVRPVLIALAMIFAFALLVDRVGYLLCTALFVSGYLAYFGRYHWIGALLGGAIFAVGSAYLWANMGMLLPRGIVPWP